MTTQAGVQIRFVKCPRCRKILPESPEVSMYMCGWCGIVLQAITRPQETNQTESPSQETDYVAEGRQENVLGQTGDGSSNTDLNDAPNVEFSPDGGHIPCQDERDDSVSSSPDITSPQSESAPLEVKESLGNKPLGRSSKRYQRKSNDHDSKTSKELHCSSEIILEAKTCISEAREHVDQNNLSQLHRDLSLEKKHDEESQTMWPEAINFVDEVKFLPKYEDQESVLPERMEDNYVLPENDEANPTSSTNQNGESRVEIKHVGPDSPSGIISHENDIISPTAELVDDGPKDQSSITERCMTLNPIDSIRAPQSPSKGSLVSFYLTSDDEQQEHSKEVAHKFRRFSSFDTMGSSHLGDLSSELNFGSGSTAYYSATRNYYGYDVSESSDNGIDDQVHKHVSHPSRKDKDREELRGDGLSGNNMVNSETEGNDWVTSPSDHAIYRPRSQVKSTETYRPTVRNRMRLDVHEDVSILPLPSRDHHIAGRRLATISGHQLPPPHTDFNLSNNSACSDPDKIDLLRTVYQLTDQLQRMQFPKVMSNRRFPGGGNSTQFSYNIGTSERDNYVAGQYNRQHDRVRCHGERYNDPRIAFSGDASHFRHQASCTCLHCCPQNWHYSAQLPLYPTHCKHGHRVIHTDSSNSLSPQRYASSEPSWGCGTQYDNQRLPEIERLQLREKYQMAKRHLRPIAGGAPLIACYHCAELLQLPVDFLPFKKRYHKLMCKACRKVLKFSFLKGTTHLVPYIPDMPTPPPSEVGDYKETSGQRNPEPLPHSSSCQHVEALSCSDDYGQSFCRSCSTEGEASVVLPPLDKKNRDSYYRKMSSQNSYEPVVDSKLKGILKEAQRQNDVSLESVESVGSSRTRNWRNATTSVSEIEELPPLANPPLHRLMGYSTPSKVFKR